MGRSTPAFPCGARTDSAGPCGDATGRNVGALSIVERLFEAGLKVVAESVILPNLGDAATFASSGITPGLAWEDPAGGALIDEVETVVEPAMLAVSPIAAAFTVGLVASINGAVLVESVPPCTSRTVMSSMLLSCRLRFSFVLSRTDEGLAPVSGKDVIFVRSVNT